MKYNPQIHHRRSIRLKGYDYSQAGLYFITICCQDMKCRFGEIGVGDVFTPSHSQSPTPSNPPPQMILNEFGKIAYNEWLKLPEQFPNFELDVYQIMPNHMHGIILLNETEVGARFTCAQNITEETNETGQPQGIAPTIPPTIPQGIAPNKTIGDIVGAYKSLVSNGCLEIYKTRNEFMGKLFQRNYYEHIIRDEEAYQNISAYIINNPSKWWDDKFYRK